MMNEKDVEGGHQLHEDRTKRKQKLQQLVDSIMATKKTERKSVSKSIGPYTRSGRGRGRRSEYKVPIGWQHFSKEKFRIVMQRNGGGTRYIYRSSGEEITVKEVIEEGKALYFKDGKSKFGPLEDMTVSLVTSSGQEISDFTDRNGLPCCFTEYVKAYGLYPSQCHLYLRTKVTAESDTHTCFGKKEQLMCFHVNNSKAGTMAISYEKSTQSVYDDSKSSISVKSYRTCMSLAKEALEDYNVFDDGYTVNGVMKDNTEYLVDKENVYNFPQMSLDPNKVVCFIHGPDIIHGSETDDLEHLIIGCLTIFHNMGHLHNWYKDGELVDSGINRCILRIDEPGTYTVEVVGNQSVTFSSAPLTVHLHSEKTNVTETLRTQQDPSNVLSGHLIQEQIVENTQPNMSNLFSGHLIQEQIVENIQPKQSDVFLGHLIQEPILENNQPNQSNVFLGHLIQEQIVENTQPKQSNVLSLSGHLIQEPIVENTQPNQSNVLSLSGHLIQEPKVENTQPKHMNVFSGHLIQEPILENTQPNQSNVLLEHLIQEQIVENTQPKQSTVFSGHLIQEPIVENTQLKQSNVLSLSGHLIQEPKIENTQPNQSNVISLSGHLIQEPKVENTQPKHTNVFSGHLIQEPILENTQPNQSNVLLEHLIQEQIVENTQPKQSTVCSGHLIQEPIVENTQLKQSNVLSLSGHLIQEPKIENTQPNQSNVISLSGHLIQEPIVENTQPDQLNVFNEICVPRITMDQVQLYEQIGQGAFGTVFRGTWLGTVVAVKRITVKRMRLVRSMVIREITVHSRVHHPNIVQLMAFAIEGSELNLISEYIDGRNLDEILFSDEKCVEICLDKKIEMCLQILRAVAYLHNQAPSIIHRDIKPENILVSNDLSKVYVCDMGLSKIKTMNTLATTFAGGEQPGTPAYKAPELETGSASTMSDVWSLSCTLLELFIEDCVWRCEMDEKDIKQQKIKRMDPDGLKTFLQLNYISDNIKDTIRNGLSYLPLERPTALEMLSKFSE